VAGVTRRHLGTDGRMTPTVRPVLGQPPRGPPGRPHDLSAPTGEDRMQPRFSIVVPCFNEAGYIADTVNSLHDQTFDGSYEIIVVDNNCTDATADIARALGVRVVSEQNPGVCWARQKGTEESAGEIVISADADTRYARDWLAKIDRSFGTDERIVAVTGPCRYVGGPLWGRVYARLLFGVVHLVYRLTGRTVYATATNIAFRKKHWSGYAVHLTQGGDELNLLRDLRRKGRVVCDRTNPTYTSSRRMTRGVLYGIFVTLLVYYLLAYFLNRLCKRRVIGSAPAYRDDRSLLSRRLQAAGLAALCGFLLLLPFTQPRHYIVHKSHSVVHYVTTAIVGAERG
jgi:glycosyltransferase involved in cell wall biosynthesis